MKEYNFINKSFETYQGKQFVNNISAKVSDAIVVEAPLQININKQAYTVVMRTPSDDFQLIRGLLYAEDVYRAKDELIFELVKDNTSNFTIINVKIPDNKLGKGYLTKRSLLSVSSCGICGKQELDDVEISTDEIIKTTQLFLIDKISSMFDVMRAKQILFHQTGGSHAAAIFDENYQLLTCKEDIGRHNAVDKCVGQLLVKNQLKKAFCMLVSGRVSYEIITKAFFAKINIVIAVSACSSLAIDYAKEFGICLIGFTRENKMTVYANSKIIVK